MRRTLFPRGVLFVGAVLFSAASHADQWLLAGAVIDGVESLDDMNRLQRMAFVMKEGVVYVAP